MKETANLNHREAKKPFYFNTSSHLLRIGQEKATTLAELLHSLHTCSSGSIFQHTFRTLQEHHFIREGFSNDFAHWAFSACNEPGLAERLSSLDVREFTASSERRAREPFYFCASESVVLPTPFVAHNIPQFVEDLARVSVHSIHHHFIEARLRLKLNSNDFSQWLEEEDVPEAAAQLNRIDIYTATLEDVRRQIVLIVKHALA